ncbi:hypothetical protein ACRAWD_23135 [Caulobacter segnis]
MQIAALGPPGGSTIVRWSMGRPGGDLTSFNVGSVSAAALSRATTGQAFLAFTR